MPFVEPGSGEPEQNKELEIARLVKLRRRSRGEEKHQINLQLEALTGKQWRSDTEVWNDNIKEGNAEKNRRDTGETFSEDQVIEVDASQAKEAQRVLQELVDAWQSSRGEARKLIANRFQELTGKSIEDLLDDAPAPEAETDYKSSDEEPPVEKARHTLKASPRVKPNPGRASRSRGEKWPAGSNTKSMAMHLAIIWGVVALLYFGATQLTLFLMNNYVADPVVFLVNLYLENHIIYRCGLFLLGTVATVWAVRRSTK